MKWLRKKLAPSAQPQARKTAIRKCLRPARPPPLRTEAAREGAHPAPPTNTRKPRSFAVANLPGLGADHGLDRGLVDSALTQIPLHLGTDDLEVPQRDIQFVVPRREIFGRPAVRSGGSRHRSAKHAPGASEDSGQQHRASYNGVRAARYVETLGLSGQARITEVTATPPAPSAEIRCPASCCTCCHHRILQTASHGFHSVYGYSHYSPLSHGYGRKGIAAP